MGSPVLGTDNIQCCAYIILVLMLHYYRGLRGQGQEDPKAGIGVLVSSYCSATHLLFDIRQVTLPICAVVSLSVKWGVGP